MGIRINEKKLQIFMILFPFMEPALIQNAYPRFHTFFLILKLLSVTYIVMYHIVNFYNSICERNSLKQALLIYKRPVSFSMLLLLMYLFVNTWYQGDFVRTYIINALSIMAILIFMSDNTRYIKEFLEILMIYIEALVYLNLIMVILYPSGMYISFDGQTQNWLLGYDNYYIQTFLPGMAMCWIQIKIFGYKIRPLLLIAMIHISTMITMPGTVLICLLLIDILYFIGIYKKKIFSFSRLAIIIIVLTVGIVFYNIQSYFAFIFEWLDKDLTFTGRTSIWTRTLLSISKSPIIGYGYRTSSSRMPIAYDTFNSHNMLLEYCWEGGVVAIILFGISVYFTAKYLKLNIRLETARILSACLVVILISFITQAYMQTFPVFIYIIWDLVDYIPEIECITSVEDKSKITIKMM